MADLCRATMIAAPGSHSGKTVVTAALARRWNNQGKRVQVFKVGPDFLDPMVLELASRRPVYNLDLLAVTSPDTPGRRWLVPSTRQSNTGQTSC